MKISEIFRNFQNWAVFSVWFLATHCLIRAGLGIHRSKQRLELALKACPLLPSAKISTNLTWGCRGEMQCTPPSRSLSGFSRIVVHCFLYCKSWGIGSLERGTKKKREVILVKRANVVLDDVHRILPRWIPSRVLRSPRDVREVLLRKTQSG